MSPIEQQIKAKIEKIGTPLKDWDINIYRGILTGFNEAFIIDGKTKDELIKKSPKNAEIIRPINEIEKERINDIFGTYVHSLFYTNAVNTVKELITPTVDLSSQADYVSFVIDSKMLHKPNNKKTATEILTRISRFNFDTKKGLILEIKEICLPQSEIAGTGIEIAYTGGNATFINSSRLVISNGANISIPSKKINAEVKNLNLNNKIISGDIISNSNEISSYFKNKGFKINVSNEKIHFEKTIK